MSPAPLVSILFLSHNRPKTLIPVFESFLSNTDYPRDRLELLLSDDGSEKATLAAILPLRFDRKLLSDRVQGLGANQNKAVRGATGDYLLSLQDDCLITGPSDWLSRAVKLLEANADIHFLSLLPRPELPTRETRANDDGEVRIIAPLIDEKGRPCAYPYSDQPHLKRPTFHHVAGYYREDVPMHVMEVEFCRRTAAMPALTFAYVPELHPFTHIGADDSFNPANQRHRRIERRESLPVVGPLLAWSRRTVKRLLGRR